jgi:hypothetical protein
VQPILLKEKINIAPALALPNLQQPIEIDIDASDYAMGAIAFLLSYRFAYTKMTRNERSVCFSNYMHSFTLWNT